MTKMDPPSTKGKNITFYQVVEREGIVYNQILEVQPQKWYA